MKITDEQRAKAALHALDALDPSDAHPFEEEIANGPTALRAEVDAFRETAAALALSAPAVPARAQVRQRLLAAIAADKRDSTQDPYAPSAKRTRHVKRSVGGKAVRGAPEFFFATAQQLDWDELYPGVDTKLLTPDAPPGARARLIRVAPGAQIPAHPHAWVEHCYVVEGDFRVAEEHLGPGDYHRAGRGTRHGKLGSDRGCVFLVVEAHA